MLKDGGLNWPAELSTHPVDIRRSSRNLNTRFASVPVLYTQFTTAALEHFSDLANCASRGVEVSRKPQAVCNAMVELQAPGNVPTFSSQRFSKMDGGCVLAF